MQSLINLSGDYVTFDVGEKKKQKVKIVGTHKNPWFCGKDVCEILEYKDIQNVLFKHVKPKYKKDLKTLAEELHGKIPCNLFGQNNFKNLSYHAAKAVYINEPGLYSLIMHSKTSFAEAFQDLVYEVILPSIRQHETYTLEKEFEEKLSIEQKARKEAEMAAKKAESRALTFEALSVAHRERLKNQIFYIITTKAIAKDGEFKIGGIEPKGISTKGAVQKRLASYFMGLSQILEVMTHLHNRLQNLFLRDLKKKQNISLVRNITIKWNNCTENLLHLTKNIKKKHLMNIKKKSALKQ